jgi:hypothetical protein
MKMSKVKVDVPLPSVPMSKEVTTKQRAYREFVAHVVAANPEALPKAYAKQWQAAMTAPLDKKNPVNIRRLARSERQSRRWMKKELGISVGDEWKLGARDWAAFFDALIDFMSQLIPLFAMCGV